MSGGRGRSGQFNYVRDEIPFLERAAKCKASPSPLLTLNSKSLELFAKFSIQHRTQSDGRKKCFFLLHDPTVGNEKIIQLRDNSIAVEMLTEIDFDDASGASTKSECFCFTFVFNLLAYGGCADATSPVRSCTKKISSINFNNFSPDVPNQPSLDLFYFSCFHSSATDTEHMFSPPAGEHRKEHEKNS